MFRWLFLGVGIVLVGCSSVTSIEDRSGVLDANLPRMQAKVVPAPRDTPSQTASVAAPPAPCDPPPQVAAGADPAPEDQEPQPPTVAFDPATIRQTMGRQIDAGKYEIAAKALEACYKAPEDVPIDYLGQRTVFGLFAVSSPAVDKTTAAWLKADPESPYALTARGWYLFHMGNLMRGDEWTTRTSPDALQEAHALYAEAEANAAEAFEKMPDLVGASDLLILSAMHVKTAQSVPEIVDAVMKVKPNRGTLRRAALALSPQWGGHGDIEPMLALCGAHAGEVTNVANYSVDVCKADLYNEFDVNPGFIPPHIPASGSWVLTKARAKQAIATRDTSPAGQKALERYLFDQNVTDTRAAQFLDSAIYAPAHHPLVSFDVYSRLVTRAIEDFARDPLNAQLIEMSTTEMPPQPGQPQRKLPNSIAPEEMFAAYRKTLDASPYSASVWLHLAQSVSTISRKADASTAFYRNAIAYSNNSPDVAGYYAMDLAMTATTTKEGLSNTQKCDFVRAAREYGIQCRNGGTISPYCRMGFDPESWDVIRADIQASGACEEVFSADPKDLAFEPEKINWSEYGG